MSKNKKAVKSGANTIRQNPYKKRNKRNIGRIALIASAIFLAIIVMIVVIGFYNNEIKPLNQPAIEVNDTSFDMAYYIERFDAYTRNLQPESVSFMTESVANQIIRDELIRQGAGALAVVVSNEEVESALELTENVNEEIYIEIMESELRSNKVLDYFNNELPDEVEQVQISVMLVENEVVADTVISRIDNRENFSVMMDEYSVESEGNADDLWLPEKLIANHLVSELVFTLIPGEIGKISDETIGKDIGYWLIEVTAMDEIKGIEVSAMLLGSLEQAKEIKGRLEVEDFNTLAAEYSQHESGENGGDLGWMIIGDMGNDIFDGVAFDLPINLVSDPVYDSSVETLGGCWVVELLAREDHELAIEPRNVLAQEDFNIWLLEQENNSTIVNHLDSESTAWAVKKVLRDRK